MSEVIAAESRTEFGKGAARRVRREGKVPAVLYGHGTEPRHVSLPGHDLMLALKHGGANTLLELELEGAGKELALAKSVVRDAIKGTLEHIDLLLVRRGEKVHVDVPIVVTGDVARDGRIETSLTSIAVEAEATHIPDSIELDVTGLEIGTVVAAKDLKLPQGTTLTGDSDAAVIHIVGVTDADVTTEADIEAEAAAEVAADEAAAAAEASAE